MADVTKLKQLVDAYGVAVRAGVITPCIEDEVALRAQFDLPDMPSAVRADWEESGGIRKPITIQSEGGSAPPPFAASEDEDG